MPRLFRPGSHTISPTALYTGQVWLRNGMGDPALDTRLGSAAYVATRAVMTPLEWLGGPTLEHFLLARHRILDLLLGRAVEERRVGQVVELACGMSPRGLLLRRVRPEVTYVEVDLPDVAERKEHALDRIDALGPQHRVEAVDVFSSELGGLFGSLDPGVGVAVITEGLLNYFPTDRVEELWRRLAAELGRFPHGLYLSDLHLDDRLPGVDRAFATGLGLLVRGRVHFHYASQENAERALEAAGFASGTVHRPADYAGLLPGMSARGADRVRLVEGRA